MTRHIPIATRKTAVSAFAPADRIVDRRAQYKARKGAYLFALNGAAVRNEYRRSKDAEAAENVAAFKQALKDLFGGLLLVALGWLCIHLLFSL
jgi:hypothetical protein